MKKAENFPTMKRLEVEYLPVDALIPYARNSRTHSDEQVAQIAGSIKEFGFTNPVLIDSDGGIIAGHGRVLASRKLSLEQVPCIRLDNLSDAQRRAYVIADNKLALNAGWDDEMLRLELGDLMESGFDMSLVGFTEEELAALLGGDSDSLGDDGDGNGSLADRFMVAPFSVINAREGWWQDRKRNWLALGIKSEEGRGDNSLGFSAGLNGAMGGKSYDEAKAASKATAKSFNTSERMQNKGLSGGCSDGNAGITSGTSIFDPVLCELAYRWFSPVGGTIIDPFAGGSVRGIVASKLGRQYIGSELRAEQVEANRAQGDDLCSLDQLPPVWYCGDSRHIDKTCKDVKADFLFSCPPYADLEVYSDDPQDLSTLAYGEFKAAYFEIIKRTCSLLKQDRFAAFVVGEVRDKRGAYYNFVGDTVQAFRDAGLDYYNEAILITMVGSLPIRAGKQFSASRKLGKTHQNILVFVKGDPKKAVAACGEVTIDETLFDEVAA